MDEKSNASQKLAAAITRASSAQTYLTIRILVDRDLVADAYRAYAYFRFVDDQLDAEDGSYATRSAYLERQQFVLDACLRGEAPAQVSAEEQMLVDLVSHNRGENSGLLSYLRNMMAFDVERRGRLISQAELNAYSLRLATAVTDALLYFIGNAVEYPRSETRYLAVEGAHIVHMLRDLLEDTAAGHFNIPRETLAEGGFTIQAVDHPAYRRWVQARIQLAVQRFKTGRTYILGSKNLRCRLAGLAYLARFEWMTCLIIRDDYRLRAAFPQRKSWRATVWMGWSVLSGLLGSHGSLLKQPEPALFNLKK